jgi:DNA-binding NtrC family response regulator
MEEAKMKNTILIIGSSKKDELLLSKMFAGRHKLNFAHSVTEALLVYSPAIPGMVIFDVETANKETLSDLEALKRMVTKRTPIVVAVSRNSLQAERAVRSVGIFYYTVKPYKKKEIGEVVKIAMRK